MHPVYKAFAGKFHRWINTTYQQPTAGAEVMAFASEMLPLYDWKGPGEIVRRQFSIIAPQVYQAQQVIPTGLAGIAAGQIVSAALMDNIQSAPLS